MDQKNLHLNRFCNVPIRNGGLNRVLTYNHGNKESFTDFKVHTVHKVHKVLQ